MAVLDKKKVLMLSFKLSLKIVGFAITMTAILLSAYLIIWNRVLHGTVSLRPHTSVTFPLSGFYCESLTLSREVWDDSEAALAWDATLYVLSEEHEYEKTLDFTIANDNITLSEGKAVRWYMRYVHLHKGSSFTVNSCLTRETGNSVKLCVVQSEKGYNNWVSDPLKCRGLEYSLVDCESNVTHPLKTVSEDTTYYFIHYTNKSNKGQSLQMSILVTSVDYDAESNTAPNCTCSNFDSCSIAPIQMDFRGYGLVTVAIAANQTNQSWSWEDTIKVSWSCRGTGTSYALVVVFPIIAITTVALVLAIVFSCYCGIKYSGKNKPCSCSNRKTRLACVAVSSILVSFVIVAPFVFVEGILPILVDSTIPRDLVLISDATRTFSFKKFFCSSLTIDMQGSSRLSASLYLTDTAPSLDQSNMKAVDDRVICSSIGYCYQLWRAYMHEDSSLNAITRGFILFEAYFLILNTTEELSDFQSFPITYISRSESIQRNFSFHLFVSKSKEYIFIVFGKYFVLDVTLQFHFTEYSTPLGHQLVCETHTFTTTKCVASIPYGVGTSNAILKVSKDGEDFDDRFEYLNVDTRCHKRASGWMAIFLPVLVVNYALVFPIALFVAPKSAKTCCTKESSELDTNEHPIPSTDGEQQLTSLNDCHITSRYADIKSIAMPHVDNDTMTVKESNEHSLAQTEAASGESYHPFRSSKMSLSSCPLADVSDTIPSTINHSVGNSARPTVTVSGERPSETSLSVLPPPAHQSAVTNSSEATNEPVPSESHVSFPNTSAFVQC